MWRHPPTDAAAVPTDPSVSTVCRPLTPQRATIVRR